MLALLLAAGSVQADYISWSYSWSRNPMEVHADSPGTGTISLTDEGQLQHVVGNSDVVATNLRTTSTALPGSPDNFTNAGYTLSLFLQDGASNASGTLTFSGVFNGTLTATSSNLTNTFTGDLTQSIVLGNYRYTATIGPFVPPGPPNSTSLGTISAFAQVTVETVPEPGALLLACLALPPFLGAAVRRRRSLPASVRA